MVGAVMNHIEIVADSIGCIRIKPRFRVGLTAHLTDEQVEALFVQILERIPEETFAAWIAKHAPDYANEALAS